MFDSHVHAAPDVVARRHHDVDLAASGQASGLKGFVLKAHYESTVGRASALSRLTGLDVVGGLALNSHCGGINPAAVASALESGGRVIWLPTADAHLQQTAGLPRLCDVEPRAGRHTYALPSIDPASGPAADDVLRLVADHDAVLATGHVSVVECRWVHACARAAGVRRLLYTHPSYTVPGLGPDIVGELSASGGYVEITAYQLLHQPGCTPAFLARVARAAGKQLILSSDVGQPDSPEPAEALERLIDELAGEGLDRRWLVAAASDVPARLILTT